MSDQRPNPDELLARVQAEEVQQARGKLKIFFGAAAGVGKPIRPRWKEVLFGSVVDELVRQSGEIDVYVISGDPDEPRPSRLPALQRTSDWSAYRWGLASVVISTALAWLMFPYFELSNLIMAYLLGVVFVAARLGRGPSILASVTSVA